MRVTTELELERGEEVLTVTVEGCWYGEECGNWDHPGDPAHLEDIQAHRKGSPVVLTEDEVIEAQEALMDAVQAEHNAAMEEQAENRADERAYYGD